MKLSFKILTLCFLLPFLSIVSVLLSVHFGDENIKTTNLLSYFGNIISYVIVFLIAFKINILKLGSNKISFNEVIFSLGVSVVLFFSYYLEFHLFKPLEKPNFDFSRLIYVLFAVPIIEEVFNKKIVFKNLLQLKLKPYLAILLSASYFALSHLPEIYITHFVFGLVTTFIYFNKKNLIQTILIHSFYNMSIIVFNII